MGMTIWVNYLKDGKVTSDESDKSAMYQHLDKLDKLCSKLHIRRLSEFLDTTDLEANMHDKLSNDTNIWEIMAQKGKWFPPDDGIIITSALVIQLQKEPIRFGLLSDNYHQVLADLIECQSSIEKAKSQDAKFHLCVVL